MLIWKKDRVNPKASKQLICKKNLHVERNYFNSFCVRQKAIQIEDCFETMDLVEFSLFTFPFSKLRYIPAYLLRFSNALQEKNLFRALPILKKPQIFVIYWCKSPAKQSDEKRKTPKFQHHAEGTLWNTWYISLPWLVSSVFGVELDKIQHVPLRAQPCYSCTMLSSQ